MYFLAPGTDERFPIYAQWDCRKLDMSQKRKFVSDYVSGHAAAEYSELLRVLRQELRAHYELPNDLPHQILTLMMALNDQGESDEGREV
jgi:hypothetical protein